MKRLIFAGSIIVAAVGWLAGCGGRDVPIVTINGKLTFGGAPPPKEGKIMFSPVEDPKSKLLARPGYAKVDAGGSFTVTTYSPGDGLIPGKYQAKILCFRETPTLTNQDSVSYVPTDFHPEFTIPANAGSSFAIAIDVPAARVQNAAPK